MYILVMSFSKQADGTCLHWAAIPLVFREGYRVFVVVLVGWFVFVFVFYHTSPVYFLKGRL